MVRLSKPSIWNDRIHPAKSLIVSMCRRSYKSGRSKPRRTKTDIELSTLVEIRQPEDLFRNRATFHNIEQAATCVEASLALQICLRSYDD